MIANIHKEYIRNLVRKILSVLMENNAPLEDMQLAFHTIMMLYYVEECDLNKADISSSSVMIKDKKVSAKTFIESVKKDDNKQEKHDRH